MAEGSPKRKRTSGSAASGSETTLVLAATILGSSMAFISESALTVALPALQTALDAEGSELLWVVNGYPLILASFILVGGSLGDRLGLRRVYFTGILLFALASLLCGLAPSVSLLIAGRVLQGIGGSLMIPGSLALLTAAFDARSRGKAIGTWAALTTTAMIAGSPVGGLLVEFGFWRGVFLLNLPFAAAALVTLSLSSFGRSARRSGEKSERVPVDFPGAVLVTVGLAGLAWGFTSAPDLGFSSPLIIGSLIIGMLALIAFLLVERHRQHPMVSLHLFSSRTFSGANLLTLFLYGGLYGYILFFTLDLIQAQGYRESLAGIAVLPFVILLAAISRWSGTLVNRTGPRLPLILGPAVVTVGIGIHALIGSTGGPSEYWTTFFPAVSVVGIGMGITVAPLTTTVMSSVSLEAAGTASGVNNATSRLAAVLAIAVLGGVALFTFGRRVDAMAVRLGVTGDARTELQQEAARLGDAEVPASIPSELRSEAASGLRSALVSTFSLMMILCAGLAALSAVTAAVFIENTIISSESEGKEEKEKEMQNGKKKQLIYLLNNASEAHHRFEQEQLHGVYDENWPDWYSGYLLHGPLKSYLNQNITADDLNLLLRESAGAYRPDGQEVSWSEFTADRMLHRYG